MTSLLFERSFIKGPKLKVCFFLSKDSDFKVELTQSDQFTAHFFVDLPSTTREDLLKWMTAYGQKENPPSFLFPRQNLPSFSLTVLQTMQKIPFGATCSYQELAVKAQSPKACRAVGTICRLNSFPLFIPCHRVLPKNGSLGGFAFGPALKQELLDFEKGI